MRRIRMVVAYDGTEFAGFQSLPDRRTVQAALEAALSAHCGEPIRVSGAGRTDAGVHAEGQVVHFDTRSRTPADRYPEALGRRLPPDLAAIRSEEVPGEFHARYSAVSRVYRYAIVPRRRSPLLRRFAWTPAEDGEIGSLDAARLIGERDFRCFASVGEAERSTVRRVIRAETKRVSNGCLFTVEANAFLRGMVRWIVGALWAKATGRLSEPQYLAMLAGRGRPAALVPAPACGLCMVRVHYRGEGEDS